MTREKYLQKLLDDCDLTPDQLAKALRAWPEIIPEVAHNTSALADLSSAVSMLQAN